MSADDHRVATTDQIVAMNNEAIKNDYNRQLWDEGTLRGHLDPDGLHIVTSIMIHEHAQGRKVDPHMRCTVLLARADASGPESTMLDIPMSDFNALPTVTQMLEIQRKADDASG